jgi:potassium-dependent mechanosensitive channel
LLRFVAALCVVAASLVVTQPVLAQGRPPLTVAEIQSRIAALGSADVEEGVKTAATRTYQDALTELERAAQASARALAFQQQTEETKRQLKELRASTQASGADFSPPKGGTLAQLEDLSQRAEEALSQARGEIERIQSEITQRTSRGTDLTELLTRLKRDERGLVSGPPAAEGPVQLREALDLTRRARLKAVEAEISAAQAEQAYLDQRRELQPESLSAAKREVTRLLASLKTLQGAVAERRLADAAAREAEARRLEREANRSPLIHEAGIQLKRYTAIGTTLSAELTETEARLSRVRTRLSDQRGSFRIVRRKVDAAGVTEAMGFVLRNQLKGLESKSDLVRDHEQTQRRLSAVQFELITLEEARNALADPALELEGLLKRIPLGAGIDREVLRRVGLRVLEGRKTALSGAIRAANDLFRRLVELDHLIGEQIKANSEYRSYVEERILWVPSVAGGGVPNPGDAREAAAWLATSPGWRDAFQEVFRSERISILVACLLGLLTATGMAIAAHVQLRRDRSQEVDPEGRLNPGIRSAILSAVRALPIPLGLYLLGTVMLLPEGPVPGKTFVVSLASGAALQAAALLLFGLLLTRGFLDPRGLAGLHLRWGEEGLRYARRHLLWLIVLKVSATFFVVALDDQPSYDNAYGDSLGRLAFVVGELALALFLALVFRPSGPTLGPFFEANADSWLVRFRHVWVGIAVVTPLVLAGLALRGFYFTATSLDERLKASLGLVLGLLLAGGLLSLWIESARARRARIRAEEAAEREEAMRRSQLEGLPVDEEPEDLYEIDALDGQLRQLFRVGAGLLLLVGLNLIWGDVLPALKRLDRVQVWPRIEVLEQTSQNVHYPTLEGSEQERQASEVKPTPSSEAPAEEPSALTPGLLPATPKVTAAALPARVTLADLGLALILLFFTVAAARSLPALLELVLLPRLPLDVGARYAVATVARYLIVFLGVSAGATAIGIGWDNLQWLVAALTFGLAFGLQEIFANFVSGLIILFERPVRVGDQITIGDITGVVTRLRMRATTIRQEDDRELIVPNRELVTGQVINWSLSDSSLRVAIKVGVAYGSDVLLTRRLLLTCARRDRQVLRRPRPQALFLNFGESSLDFTLRVWVAHPAHRWEVVDRLHRSIDAAFRAEDIVIAFPQQDLHLVSAPTLEGLAHPAPVFGASPGQPPAVALGSPHAPIPGVPAPGRPGSQLTLTERFGPAYDESFVGEPPSEAETALLPGNEAGPPTPPPSSAPPPSAIATPAASPAIVKTPSMRPLNPAPAAPPSSSVGVSPAEAQSLPSGMLADLAETQITSEPGSQEPESSEPSSEEPSEPEEGSGSKESEAPGSDSGGVR